MNLKKKHCKPCEGGTPELSDKEEESLLQEVPEWDVNRDLLHKISRDFKFKNFKQSMEFVNKVAGIAEQEGHHPDIHIYHSSVTIELYTHAILGLSENDFIVAAKINGLRK